MPRCLSVALCVVVAAWYTWALVPVVRVQPLTLDESIQVGLSSLPVTDLLRLLPRNDPHPPGFYLLLKGWMALVGQTPAMVRGLNLGLGLGLLVLVFGWTRWAALWCWSGEERMASVAAWAATVFLVCDMAFLHMVWWTRGYVLAMGLTVAFLWAAGVWWRVGRPAACLAACLMALALVLVNYLGWMVVVLWLVVWLVAGRGAAVQRRWMVMCGGMAVVGVVFALVWGPAMAGAPLRHYPMGAPDVTPGFLARAWLMLHSGLMLEGMTTVGWWLQTVLGVAAVGVAVVTPWRHRRAPAAWLTALAVWCALQMAAVLVLLWLVRNVFQARFFCLVLGPYALLVGMGVATAWRAWGARGRSRPAGVVLGVVSAAVVLSPWTMMALSRLHSTEVEPYGAVARLLRQEGVQQVVHTGPLRFPLSYTMGDLPAIWANTEATLAMALQGQGKRAAIAYPTDEAYVDKLLQWGGRQQIVTGLKTEVAVFFFEEALAVHGVALDAGWVQFPLGGTHRCGGSGASYVVHSGHRQTVQARTACAWYREQRPTFPILRSEDVPYARFLYWFSWPYGPFLEHQRSGTLPLWQPDQIPGPQVSVMAPRGPGKPPALVLVPGAHVVYAFHAERAGAYEGRWRWTSPRQAVLRVAVDGAEQSVHLGPHENAMALHLRRAGTHWLTVKNPGPEPVTLETFAMRLVP